MTDMVCLECRNCGVESWDVPAWAGVGAKANKISLSVVEESPGVRALTEVACQNTNLPLK